MAYIWTHDYIKQGNKNGIIVELDDGTLLNGGFDNSNVNRSTDGGRNWTTSYTGTGRALMRYVTKAGHVYFGNNMLGGAGARATVIRSTNGGQSFTTVLTVDSGAVWHMVEDSAGNLYVSEYSAGNNDANELYAYNVWKSTDNGLNWTKWHIHAAQSTPGAKDEIRHIHGLYIDSNDQIYIGYGDYPGYGGDAGKNYKLNSNGTLGTYMGLFGNGVLSGVEANDGRMILTGDASTYEIYRYNSTNNTYAVVLTPQTSWGTKYNSPVYRAVKGRDGVIYARMNNENTGVNGGVVASADNGVTWHLLDIQNHWLGGIDMYVNPNRQRSQVYVSNAGRNYISFPDLTKDQLNGFVTGGRIPVEFSA